MSVGEINLNSVPSLEHMATIKIIATLFNRDDFRTSFGMSDLDSDEIENNMKHEVSKLLIPNVLKQRALNLIRPIVNKILKWRYFKKEEHKLDLILPSQIFFTLHGAIDEKRTAELMIKDCNLSNIERYHLACYYCLETEIISSWKILPNEYKTHVINHEGAVLHGTFCAIWACVMTGEMYRGLAREVNGSLFQTAFSVALEYCNLPAAECFFQKLTPAERKEALNHVLNEWINWPFNADCVHFLLTQMDEEQRTNMFKNFAFDVLLPFLIWPWQDLFMQLAEHLLSFLANFQFGWLFTEIITKLEHGFNDFNYQLLLKKFWLQGLKAHKQYFLSDVLHYDFLQILFVLDDDHKQMIKLILKDATANNLEKMISFCDDVINRTRSLLIALNKGKEMLEPECIRQWIRFRELVGLTYKENSDLILVDTEKCV